MTRDDKALGHPGIEPGQLDRLLESAQAASRHAYAPYSGFPVGASVLTGSGSVFSGCNVENSSFGITSCAERNAIAAAVLSGARSIAAVAVYTPGQVAHAPCGACRQAIHELAVPGCEIVSASGADARVQWRLEELLPAGFRLLDDPAKR